MLLLFCYFIKQRFFPLKARADSTKTLLCQNLKIVAMFSFWKWKIKFSQFFRINIDAMVKILVYIVQKYIVKSYMYLKFLL